MVDFQEVYNLYFRDVYKYALSLSRDSTVAEEITQETFFKAMKSIGSFRGQCRLYVWLCQIAKNTYISYSQKQSRIFPEMECADESTLEEHFLNKESAFEIHKVLHRLPEPYKEVFSLRIFGELSFGQIGGLFGKSAGWARVTFYRAKQRIIEDRERAEKNERT